MTAFTRPTGIIPALGFCPLGDKKNIEYLFRPYAALGGNGTGKQAYDDIMNLPTEAAGGKG